MAVPTSGINSPHRARRYDPSADKAPAPSPAENVAEPVSEPLEDQEDLGDADDSQHNPSDSS